MLIPCRVFTKILRFPAFCLPESGIADPCIHLVRVNINAYQVSYKFLLSGCHGDTIRGPSMDLSPIQTRPIYIVGLLVQVHRPTGLLWQPLRRQSGRQVPLCDVIYPTWTPSGTDV